MNKFNTLLGKVFLVMP